MAYEIEEQTIDARHTATIRFTTPPGPAMGAKLAEVLPEVRKHLEDVGAQVTGAPFSLYRGMSNGTFDLEAGWPVAAPIEPSGRVLPGTLPGGNVAVTWHVGPYDTLGNAFMALDAWRKARGHASDGPDGAWEMYWSDPAEEPDPRKWRTEVVWPL
jgi:effector-binding domain-containing protein